MSDEPVVKLRQSVRGLLIDESDRVLLVRFRWPSGDGETVFWANPGGGIEPGESRLEALRRELAEETGIQIDALGPEVWTKTAMFDIEDCQGQVDHIHLQRISSAVSTPWLTEDELRAEHLHGARFWTLAELEASAETFAPRALPDLYGRLLREGPPTTPIVLSGF